MVRIGGLLALALAVASAAVAGTPGPSAGALWVGRYDQSGQGEAHDLAVSPDGSKVFVAGGTSGTRSLYPGIVAYDAVTGTELWANDASPVAWAIQASPDGSKVFATGYVCAPYCYVATAWKTVAFDAATGAQVWSKGADLGSARFLRVSPDGSKVFVAGGGSRSSRHTTRRTATSCGRTRPSSSRGGLSTTSD